MPKNKTTYFKRKLSSELERLEEFYAVLVVTGPRQSGKTTLCKHQFPDYHYINLENPSTRQLIATAPKPFLEQHASGLIIDEAQNMPELFSYVQVVVDEQKKSRFVLTGSSNLALLQGVTQSLAGRAALLTLLPLSLQELGPKYKKEDADTLMLNGGYPNVWGRKIPATDVAQNYYNTYVQRDVRQLLNVKDISRFQTFLKLCAGRIGIEFNASALSNEVGVSVPTINDWLSVLEASYILFRLPPFYKNIGKRLVKSPKLYFYDTALVCFLLGIINKEQLATHPLRGAIFENMVVLEFFKHSYNSGKTPQLYFYRDKSQNEVDLIEQKATQLFAYEIKSAKAFTKDFVKGLNYIRKVIGEDVVSTQVIYDGKDSVDSASNGVVNFKDIKFNN